MYRAIHHPGYVQGYTPPCIYTLYTLGIPHLYYTPVLLHTEPSSAGRREPGLKKEKEPGYEAQRGSLALKV